MRDANPLIVAIVLLLAAGPLAAVPISDVTNPGDPIVPVDLDGTSSSPGREPAPLAIDDMVSTKYLNFGEENSGFIVTPSNNPATHAVRSLTITTANDGEERDPASFSLFGTDDPITSAPHSDGSAESWSLIASGALSLPSTRNAVAPTVAFANDTHFESFRLIFPTVKNAGSANSMQIAEVQLDAVEIGTPPPPPMPIPDVTLPGDFIIPIDLDGMGSSSPGGEQALLSIDNDGGTKYLNFGEENAGFIVTPSLNPLTHTVTSLTITTANDAEERDPASYQLFGTNDAIASTAHSDGSAEMWTLISEGMLALPSARNTTAPTVNFENMMHYTSFRLVFPTVKDAAAANSVQLAEVQLNATRLPPIPEPATAVLGLLGLTALTVRRRR